MGFFVLEFWCPKSGLPSTPANGYKKWDGSTVINATVRLAKKSVEIGWIFPQFPSLAGTRVDLMEFSWMRRAAGR